ncbi:Predicted transporter [Methanosarcina thermophila]|nr:Predicted transporter [Methanosarcina thermophila]
MLTVIGILVGILVFGIKSGIGCGFSNISTRVILAVGGSYFLLALLFGSVIDKINLEAFEKFYSMGMGIHIFVSLLLIMTGIYTQKKWNSGKDVSRHTFLAISIPCPVCLAALAASCLLLSESLNLSGIKVGFLIGFAFFISVVASSFVFRFGKVRFGKTPETMGSAMMLIGFYYLLGALLIPAYIQTKSMNLVSTAAGETEIIPLMALGVIVFAGFFLERIRRHDL